MTSLELVELINATRELGKSALRHDSFLAKVPKVLGVETSPKFFGRVEVPGPNGGFRQSLIYRLPKREACLVATNLRLIGGNPPINDHLTVLSSS